MQSGRNMLNFPIDARLDQSIDQGAGAPPGTLSELINLRKDRFGRLKKRPGMISMPSPGSSDIVRLLPRGNSFAFVDGVGIIRQIADGVQKSSQKDFAPRWALTGATVIAQHPKNSVNHGGCVSGAGITIHVYADTVDKSIKSVTIDEASGAVLRGPETIAIINAGLGETDMPCARVTTDGTRVWVLGLVVSGGGISIWGTTLTLAQVSGGTAWPARTGLRSDVDTSDPGFDLSVNTSMAVAAYNSLSAGVHRIHVITVDGILTVNEYIANTACRAVSCWSEPGNSWIWVQYAKTGAPATTDVLVFSTALVLKATNAGADQTIGNVGSTAIGKYGSSSVMLASSSTTFSVVPFGAIAYRTASFNGVATITDGATITAYGCSLASQPISDGNDVYVWVDISTSLQEDKSTVLVALTHNGGEVYSDATSFTAALFPHMRVAAGRTFTGLFTSTFTVPQKSYPSSIDSNTWVWDGAFCVGPIFPNSVKEYRTQLAASSVNAALTPMESQGLTLCSGGAQTFAFDGEHFTELGFVYIPVDVDSYATASGAGGSIGAGTYQYAVTYEYTDASGNRHQSGPSFSSPIVLTGTTSKVTFALPSLRITTKQDREFTDSACQIVVWRTLSTDPLQYHRVDSVQNNPEAQTVTFIDTHLDSDIATHSVLYTSAGELANEMPPPLWHAAVIGGKIAGIDAEYRNRIVFSKPLKLERGPEFSSANETFVNGIGPLTAIAEMDGTLYAFSATAIAAAAWGDGIDATGQGAWPQPEVISRAAGCIDPRAICNTQDGIVFVSGRSTKLNTLRIWLLPRGGGNVVEIGKKVRTYLGGISYLATSSSVTGTLSVVACLNDEDKGRVTVHLHSSDNESFALEYDYINKGEDGIGAWNATFGALYDTAGGIASACVAGGKHRIGGANGIFTESDTIFSDDATYIWYLLRTHSIKPSQAPFGKLNLVNTSFETLQANGGVQVTLSEDDFITNSFQATHPFPTVTFTHEQRQWQPPCRRSTTARGYALQYQSILVPGGEGTSQDTQDVVPMAITLDYIALPGTHRPTAAERI